jgi:hypothetical protein
MLSSQRLVTHSVYRRRCPGGRERSLNARILTDRYAERFIAGDPFTVEGLAVPRILEWNAVRFD